MTNMKTRKVILCGTLFTSVKETVSQNMAIVIEGNRIEKICPAQEVSPVPADELIDLSDKFVMPGLIDAHVHTAMMGTEVEVDSVFAKRSIGDLALGSLKNAQKDLLAGFTTLRDVGGTNFEEIAVKKAIENKTFWGPRIVASGKPITATGGHADSHFAPHTNIDGAGFVCNSPDEIRAAVRKNMKYGAEVIKIIATGGVMSFGDDPKCSELTLEEMKAAIDTANLRGNITAAHAHGSEGIKIAVKAGITSIEHGMLMDEECIRLMAEHGTYLVPTIIAAKGIAEGEKFGLPQWMTEKAKTVIENHYENIRKCKAAGIRIGFGSDAGVSLDFHGEQTKEAEYLQEAGLTPAEILIAATRTNAEMMRYDDRIGTLEAGKLADIVAYDNSPLEDIRTLNAVSFVMKDGDIIKQNGKQVILG